MIYPPLPENEEERLAALMRYNILDTPQEQEYDEIVELASRICGTPMSLISLVSSEKQWFKAKKGVDDKDTPREYAFCAHTLTDEEILEVADASLDERFHDNPYVVGNPDIRFYAGIPLRTPDGLNLGTLCVLDNKPRELTEDQRFALRVLGKQVMKHLEVRYQLIRIKQAMDVVEDQRRTIHEQHEEISTTMEAMRSSLGYAANLQTAILPNPLRFQRLFRDHFLVYEPYDMVSGDFYWLREIDHIVVLVVGDSAGHGVPGALLSMVGHDQLNRIVSEDRVLQPRKILHLLHEGIRETFKANEQGHRDGMDISVLVWNRDSDRLDFAGARQTLVLVNDDEVKEIRGDKQSVGGEFSDEERHFTNRSFTLSEGAKAYLYTDGLADQFGGEKNKRFGSKKVRHFIEEHHGLPMAKQQALMMEKLRAWQGGLDQTDDITFLGLLF